MLSKSLFSILPSRTFATTTALRSKIFVQPSLITPHLNPLFQQTRFISQLAKKNFELRKARFDLNSVGGLEPVKNSLHDVLRSVSDPQVFDKLGLTPIQRIILSGPPGTGKTMLAEAIAGHAGLPFLDISASELVGEYIGQGERLIRELFQKAKEAAPCVVRIDEIDSIAKRFPNAKSGGEHFASSVTNQLLSSLSEPMKGVIIVVTTNNYHSLDEAIVRNGRFDRHIILSLPSQEERKKIIAVHLQNKQVSKDLDLAFLARISEGFSPAKIASWVNEAGLAAMREKASELVTQHFEATLEFQHQTSALPREEENLLKKQRKAIHEAGHALVGTLLDKKVKKVTLLMMGTSGGRTYFKPEDMSAASKEEFLDYICISMAGRASELIFSNGYISSFSDLEKAKKTAAMIVSDGLGSTLSGINASRDIENILQTELERAQNLLAKHTDKLNNIIAHLMKFNELNAEEFASVFAGEQLTTVAYRTPASLLFQLPKSKFNTNSETKSLLEKVAAFLDEPIQNVKKAEDINGILTIWVEFDMRNRFDAQAKKAKLLRATNVPGFEVEVVKMKEQTKEAACYVVCLEDKCRSDFLKNVEEFKGSPKHIAKPS